ncbi:tenascin isoform X2 [Scleropages formosus]|uniref:tenascin isoform X2 n=1 Tax=Scleropages formosus TaxID=113540 RepID=UPI0010FAA3A7|nr:tenascin-like isoform X2 [Scleropages formosus]
MLLIPHVLLLALPFSALLTMTNAKEPQNDGTQETPASLLAEPLQGTSQRIPRDSNAPPAQKPIKVLISDTCIQKDTQRDSGTPNHDQGQELDLEPGMPLVLTHRINLVPSSCTEGCEPEFAALRERLLRLEKEVSTLKEKCRAVEGGCCGQQGSGAGCSKCPNECSDQGRCVDGKCVCFPGFAGPDCSRLTCPSNCNNKGKCVNGKCVCHSGFTGSDCSEKACPNNCRNRGECVNGKCVCASGFTGPDCAGKACPNNCNNKGRCVNGKCVCDSGFMGLDCSEKACPNNCRNRGRCVNGKCVCDSGFMGLDCSEKSCPNNCRDRGRCVNGKCVCDSGFSGLDCSEKDCLNECNKRGRCVNGKCVCDSGFMGLDCSEKSCPNNCRDRGRCVNGKCVCDSGFMGLDCSEKSCPNNCRDRGECVNGKCVCDSGFMGLDCSEKSCPNNCRDRGECVNGKCVCDSGFMGLDCSEKSCPNNCRDRGECVNGKCVCDSGFMGLDCSEKSCPNNCRDRGRCVNGKCVCDSGFMGLDCSEKSCPNNCRDRGRCVNGKCECDTGFMGLDCSEKSCPNNCRDRGRCVNGKCVCDSGFMGLDCSEKSCPNNCRDRGRCVNGKCECDTGFTGPDCSTKSCPNDCSDRGRCVNGKCVCNVGFMGQDCSLKSCPANCNNRGRCVKAKCVCHAGFTGSDCGQCEAGFTGPDCSTALPGVTQLSTRDLTDSSVTIFWTQPSMQYDIYHITFTSKKEGDQRVTSTVEGWLSTYTQTGLAAGQEYTVTIQGEKDGVMGQETTIVFRTLISGPKDLRVVKTTTTTAVVQWEPPLGDIDRYRLFISPGQTNGTVSRTLTLPPGRDSAHVKGLEAGRLYNISLVAQRGRSQSQPITVQIIPGNMTKAITKKIPKKVSREKAPEMDKTEVKPTGKKKPDGTIFYKKEEGKREGLDSIKEGYNSETQTESSVKPGLKRPQVKDKKVLSKPSDKVIPPKKPKVPGQAWYNGTRTGLAGVKIEGQTLPKQPGNKKQTEKKTQMSPSKPPSFVNKTQSLTVRQIILGRSPSQETKEPHTMKEEGKTYLANITHNYTSGKQDLENLNHLSKSPNVWENRTNTNLELMEQHTMDDINGKERHEKKCVKKANGNGPTAGIALGSSTCLTPSQDDTNYGANKEIIRRNTTKIQTLDTNNGLIQSKMPAADLDTDPTKVYTVKQPSPAEHLTKTQMDTDQHKVYHSQSPTYSPTSFPQPSLPPPSASPFVGQKTMEDNQKIRGENPRVIHRTDSDTSSHRVAFPYIQFRTVAPTQHSTYSSLKVENKAGPSQPFSTITELDPEVLYHNGDQKNEKREDVTLEVDKTEAGKTEGKMPTSQHQNAKNFPVRRIHGGQLRNRTRPVLRMPYHSSRGPPRRPIKPTVKQGNNTFGGKIILSTQGWQGNYTNGQTNDSIKIIANYLSKRNNITERKMTYGSVKTDLNGTLRETGLKPKTVPSGYDSSQDVTSGGTQASKVPTYSKVSASGQSNRSTSATKQPSPGLSSVSVQNITSRGFVLIWDAPEGMFKNFIVSRYEFATENRNETNKEDEQMPKPGLSQTPDEEAGDPATVIKNKSKPDSYRKSISGGSRNDTASPSEPNHGPRLKVRGPQKFSQVIPGTARSLQFQNLRPQTRYSVSLFGMGPRIRSKMHQLKIETGPEPPSDLKFSNVTDSSFYVSWIKPRRPVTGFKVTFAHMKDGEPISLSLNSHQSSVPLSALSPGSSYEVSVISTQGMDESDPVKGVVVTAPDPPTDLRVINITDSNALLLWRPALAAVDQYIIVYGSEKGSDVMITMSGNAAEQQLKDLQGSTLYTVTVSSQLGNQRSRGSTTRFTTTSGSVDRVEGPRDLIASQVTPRSAVLTWKPPTHTLASYKLTYQTAGQEMTEVTLDGSATQHKLKRLQPKSKYTVRLQGERQGEYSVAISTDFTTGTLAFPFPTDCSQELMNGVHDSYEVEVFPNGPQGQSALVYCDMETDGGGWTVIQRRMDGKTNFFRGWREYSAGFGNISGEFWIGNELLHNLTRMTPMALRIDLRSGSESVFAHYSSFSVDTQKNHYAIQVSGYSGTAGDSMKYHNGRPFSTRDRDPNPFITRCAVSYRGGWWYKNCHEANLNGLYDTHTNHQGIIWTEWKGKDFSIPFTEMKIRPSSFTPSTQG